MTTIEKTVDRQTRALKTKEYNKRWYEKNREARILYNKQWRLSNKEHISEYIKKRSQIVNNNIKYKRKTNEKFRTIERLRSRLRGILNSNNLTKRNTTLIYLGCSIDELLRYLGEKKCRNCSSIENIEIDHIYPISKVDLSIEENIYKIMNYTNLQYLCKNCNIKKGDKIVI